jgi:hypothetical protein
MKFNIWLYVGKHISWIRASADSELTGSSVELEINLDREKGTS